jgi:hypothetical protein
MWRLMLTAVILIVAACYIGAQIPGPTSVSTLAIPTTAVATGCPTPTPNYTIYCYAADKLQASANGAAYACIWAVGGCSTPAAGVSSIVVCNAAGASCGSAQTGAVQLSIPKAATTTATTTATTSLQ